jgi:TM2 domain-containing membrane protein YozV
MNDHYVSNDTKAMMRFQAKSKSAGVAYLLWFFLGSLGVHRFYLGSIVIGLIMLVCTALSFVTIITIAVTVVIGLFDLFAIPGQVRRYNESLIAEIGG